MQASLKKEVILNVKNIKKPCNAPIGVAENLKEWLKLIGTIIEELENLKYKKLCNITDKNLYNESSIQDKKQDIIDMINNILPKMKRKLN